MESSTWILLATTDTENYIAQTPLTDSKLIYRAICKWLLRGKASNILNKFWEYIDKDDNEIEEAILDQLETQAETKSGELQTTNVKTRDYSVDITVQSKTTSETLKTCNIHFDLYVYFSSINKKIKSESVSINLIMIRSRSHVEQVIVETPTKTPAVSAPRRTAKRRSKITPAE
jgi:hypothetical protein